MNELDAWQRLGLAHPRLEPHQLDPHGDPHVAYVRVMSGETLEGALERLFRRFDDAGYGAEIATLGLARVARDEYRSMIATGALDDGVSPLELALGDVLGDVFGTEGGGVELVTVEEIAKQFVRLGWARRQAFVPSSDHVAR